MNRTNTFLTILIALGLLAWGVSYYVANTHQETRLALAARIAEQETTLVTLAELTDRNGSDSIVSNIIKNCSTEDRERFDELLNRLGSLRAAELQETETLFASCADVEANRKAIIVARMEREFSVYSDYVALHQTIDGRSESILYPIETWEQLIAFEKQRAALLSEQVQIQGVIITALQDGLPVGSKVISDSLTTAREVVESFTVLDLQIDELRATLTDV